MTSWLREHIFISLKADFVLKDLGPLFFLWNSQALLVITQVYILHQSKYILDLGATNLSFLITTNL